MKHLNKILIVTLVFSLAAAASAYAEATKAPESGMAPALTETSTLDNLQAAYNGESNAHARYLAFAAKADAEGYGKIATLFRAAARAEQVHFEWHAKLIKKLGAVPAANIEAPVVKSTAENVKAALAGETYENQIMYPAFLKKAEVDKNKDAVDAFEDAEAAEGVHAKLYKSVLENMAAWKTGGQEFYVCPLCGNVVEKTNFVNCPICGTGKEKFLAVK
jgi:rubrerythrin